MSLLPPPLTKRFLKGFFLFSIILSVVSCQKQINTKNENSQFLTVEDAITQLKSWYSQNIVAKEKIMDSVNFKSKLKRQSGPLKGRMSRIEKKLEWNLAKLYREDGIEFLVVPVKTNLKVFGENFELWKTIIFYKNDNGEFDMCVLEILSKKGKSLNKKYIETASSSFLNKFKNEQKRVEDMNCYIYFYNQEYKRIASYEYNQGNWQNSNTALKFRKSEKTTNKEFARDYENCQLWGYFITYYDDNGNVIETELIYTWWECPDGGGGSVDTGESDEPGSGGGNGESGDYQCYDSWFTDWNQLIAGTVSSETETITTSDFEPFKKRKFIRWKILNSTTFSLYSNEQGIVKLIDVPTNSWVWESLEHVSITKSGFTIGGTVTHDQGVATPSFVEGTSNVKYAGMSLNFNVTYTPVCNCPIIRDILVPLTKNYTSNGGFWSAIP